MNELDIIVGLDVGTTKVAACAGRVHEGGIEVVATSQVANNGARKGMVTDIEETVSAITSVIQDIEHTSGGAVVGVVAGIGGVEVGTQESKGVVAVARPDGEITDDDMQRAIESARSTTLPANREVRHTLAKFYTTDHDAHVHNPVGMKSIRLEVTTELITVSNLALKNLERSVRESGLELYDIVFNPLASAKAVLSKRQMESGVIFVDFGAATTDLVIFEEGQLMHAAVVPIGSMHITNDIAIGLRTNLEIAEQVKRQQGAASPEGIKAGEIIRLSEYDADEDYNVKRQALAEMIEARLDELFGMVQNQLKELDRDGRLPAGVVLTGNGSQLDGLVPYVKERLKLPAAIGRSRLELPTIHVDSEGEPDYTTSAGLMLWALDQGSHAAPRTSLPSLPTVNMGNVLDKAKDMFKQFLP